MAHLDAASKFRDVLAATGARNVPADRLISAIQAESNLTEKKLQQIVEGQSRRGIQWRQGNVRDLFDAALELKNARYARADLTDVLQDGRPADYPIQLPEVQPGVLDEIEDRVDSAVQSVNRNGQAMDLREVYRLCRQVNPQFPIPFGGRDRFSLDECQRNSCISNAMNEHICEQVFVPHGRVFLHTANVKVGGRINGYAREQYGQRSLWLLRTRLEKNPQKFAGFALHGVSMFDQGLMTNDSRTNFQIRSTAAASTAYEQAFLSHLKKANISLDVYAALERSYVFLEERQHLLDNPEAGFVDDSLQSPHRGEQWMRGRIQESSPLFAQWLAAAESDRAAGYGQRKDNHRMNHYTSMCEFIGKLRATIQGMRQYRGRGLHDLAYMTYLLYLHEQKTDADRPVSADARIGDADLVYGTAANLLFAHGSNLGIDPQWTNNPDAASQTALGALEEIERTHVRL